MNKTTESDSNMLEHIPSYYLLIPSSSLFSLSLTLSLSLSLSLSVSPSLTHTPSLLLSHTLSLSLLFQERDHPGLNMGKRHDPLQGDYNICHATRCAEHFYLMKLAIDNLLSSSSMFIRTYLILKRNLLLHYLRFTYFFIYLFTYLFIYLFIFSFIYLFIYFLFIHLTPLLYLRHLRRTTSNIEIIDILEYSYWPERKIIKRLPLFYSTSNPILLTVLLTLLLLYLYDKNNTLIILMIIIIIIIILILIIIMITIVTIIIIIIIIFVFTGRRRNYCCPCHITFITFFVLTSFLHERSCNWQGCFHSYGQDHRRTEETGVRMEHAYG